MRTLKESLYYQIHKEDPKLLLRELKRPLQTGVNSPWRPDHRIPFQGMRSEAIEHPHERLIKAELEFNSFQLRSGHELIRNQMDPQTAAELQNLGAAMEEMRRDPFVMESQFDPFHGLQMDTFNPMDDPMGGPMMP